MLRPLGHPMQKNHGHNPGGLCAPIKSKPHINVFRGKEAPGFVGPFGSAFVRKLNRLSLTRKTPGTLQTKNLFSEKLIN